MMFNCAESCPSLWLATHLFCFLLNFIAHYYLLPFYASILSHCTVRLNWFHIKFCVYIANNSTLYSRCVCALGKRERPDRAKPLVLLNCVHRTFVLLHTILRFFPSFSKNIDDVNWSHMHTHSLQRPQTHQHKRVKKPIKRFWTGISIVTVHFSLAKLFCYPFAILFFLSPIQNRCIHFIWFSVLCSFTGIWDCMHYKM